MKNIYKWFPIGIVSFVGCLISLFILSYDRKLTVSIAILCSLSLSVSILMIVRNRRWLKCTKYKGDPGTVKQLTTLTIAFVIVTLFISLILELFLSIAYWFVSPPENYKFNGLEYYQNERYKDFRFGNEASLYLPAYENLNGGKVVEFTYYDCFSIETLYFPGYTEYTLQVYYDSEQYAVQKEGVCNKGVDFGGQVINDVWLLEKKQISFGNCLYYIVICNDRENTLTYLVSVQDYDKYLTYSDFPYPGA